MSLFGDGLEAAVQKAFTRPAPKSAGAQMRYLVKQLKGTKAVAQMLRISQRTVERYVKDQIKKPRPDLAAHLDREVKKRWQPQFRAKAEAKAASTGGIVIDTRARMGYTAPIGSTDQDRTRHLTVALPPRYAARLGTHPLPARHLAQAAGFRADEGVAECELSVGGGAVAGVPVQFGGLQQQIPRPQRALHRIESTDLDETLGDRQRGSGPLPEVLQPGVGLVGGDPCGLRLAHPLHRGQREAHAPAAVPIAKFRELATGRVGWPAMGLHRAAWARDNKRCADSGWK